MPKLRKVDERLAIVLGDQLDLESAAIQRLDRQRDRIWMAEAREESTHVCKFTSEPYWLPSKLILVVPIPHRRLWMCPR